MRLLVTGGAGFIGSNFIYYWLGKYPNDEVVNLDALTYAGNLENLANLEGDKRYSFIKGDIRDKAVVEKAFYGVDTVVHFAAESHVDRSILGPEVFVKTNVEGTFVLLEQARVKNAHFHHVSTDEVFGSLELGSDEQFTEETAYDPSSPYSASKAGSDHLVNAYHRTYGLPITISNTSNNYGPYQYPEKFISLAITNLLGGKKVPVYGDGNQVRDWLYVEDHCLGIDLILKKGRVGETYLLGGQTQNLTNIEVARIICAALGKDESMIEKVKDRPGHDVRYAIDWSKAKRELGYKPQYSLEEYLQKTIDWYKANGEWWQRVKSGEYKEYYEKQYGK